jgi:hypothetical protein
MRKISKILMMVIALAAITFTATGAQAYKVNDNNEVYGYSTIWAILDENSFHGKESTQAVTGDAGKDKSFGFEAKQLRLGARGNMADGMLGYNLLFDGAGSITGNSATQIIDGWITVRPLGKDVDINIGQFRPYGGYEVGIESGGKIDNLDTYKAGGLQSSTFLVGANNTRDRGVEFVVNKIADVMQLRLSATNGVGNNGDVGGSASGSGRGILSNGMGDAAYNAAVIVTPFDGLRLNAGYGMNKHENAVTSPAASPKTDCTLGADGTTITCTSSTSSSSLVADIDRTLFSAGGKLDLSDLGLWIDAEYSSLKGADKDTVKPGYQVTGYYARVGFYVIPKALDVYARYQAWNETAKTGAAEKKNTGYDVNVRYKVENFAFTAEYEKQDLDGTSDDPVRVALRAVLTY